MDKFDLVRVYNIKDIPQNIRETLQRYDSHVSSWDYLEWIIGGIDLECDIALAVGPDEIQEVDNWLVHLEQAHGYVLFCGLD